MIGIAIVATNTYSVLAVRFIKKFFYHYKGDAKFKFVVFTDVEMNEYLPDEMHVVIVKTKHDSWLAATNSKFENILNNINSFDDCTHIYYFDADTNVKRNFNEEWFIGDLVGGEHFANNTFMIDEKNYDRNPKSSCYISKNTILKQVYYYGAFFGGRIDKIKSMCETLIENQKKNKEIYYEPIVNDESYLNHYFHYNQPSKIVKSDEFMFEISDKGGLWGLREKNNELKYMLLNLFLVKNSIFEIENGRYIDIA